MTTGPTPTRMTAWLENAWLVRYLDRRLASEEAAWFEAYALDKPELLAKIEADTRLRDALAADATVRHTERSAARGRRGGATDGADRGDVDDDGAGFDGADEPVLGTGSSPRPGQRRGAGPIAVAAVLLAGLGIGWIIPRGGSSPAGLIANPMRIVYDTMRGQAAPPRVEHGDSASPYVLVEIAVPPGATQILLQDGDETARALTPTSDGFVNALVQRKREGAKLRLSYRIGTPAEVRTQVLELPPQ